MRKLGYSANRGNSIKGLKSYLNSLGIDFSKFSNNFYSHSHPLKKIEDILIENSSYSNMTSLKKKSYTIRFFEKRMLYLWNKRVAE